MKFDFSKKSNLYEVTPKLEKELKNLENILLISKFAL